MATIRTEISIESNESLKIRRKRHSIRAWCEDCRRTSIMALPSEAAFLACKDVDSIIALMYSNQFHLRHFEDRGLYICLTSLCLFPFEWEAETSDEHVTTEILADAKLEKFDLVKQEW